MAALSSLGGMLADFHGQNEHQSLLQPEKQRELLDNYGKLDKQTEEIFRLKTEYNDLQNKIKAVSMSEEERTRLLDLYRFQLDEIESASLNVEEERDIEERLPRLKNADRLAESSGRTREFLSEAASCSEKSLEELKNLAEYDDSVNKLLARLDSAAIELNDLSETLRQYAESICSDPAELDRTMARADKIRQIKKKYGADIPAVLAKAEELRRKIQELEDINLDRTELEKLAAKAERQLKERAAALHEKRTEAAEKMSAEVIKEADGLGFREMHFSVDIAYDEENISHYGGDSIEYLFTANPGYPMRPLRFGASGGEMARIMLSLKTVLARADRIETQIFDEVDTGVGAVTGLLVAHKLVKLASDKQLLCITHLPQIASFGDVNYFVRKETVDGISAASVKRLSAAEKRTEIARMLGGHDEADEISLAHADKLIEESMEFSGK